MSCFKLFNVFLLLLSIIVVIHGFDVEEKVPEEITPYEDAVYFKMFTELDLTNPYSFKTTLFCGRDDEIVNPKGRYYFFHFTRPDELFKNVLVTGEIGDSEGAFSTYIRAPDNYHGDITKVKVAVAFVDVCEKGSVKYFGTVQSDIDYNVGGVAKAIKNFNVEKDNFNTQSFGKKVYNNHFKSKVMCTYGQLTPNASVEVYGVYSATEHQLLGTYEFPSSTVGKKEAEFDVKYYINTPKSDPKDLWEFTYVTALFKSICKEGDQHRLTDLDQPIYDLSKIEDFRSL